MDTTLFMENKQDKSSSSFKLFYYFNSGEYENYPHFIFYINTENSGKFLIINNRRKYEIRDNNTFEVIKKGNLEISPNFDNIKDAILYSKNEIIVCNSYYDIAYFKLDKNSIISNTILINIDPNVENDIYKDIIDHASLKLLKNKKFAFIAFLDFRSKIYILSFSHKYNKIILETKIKTCSDTVFYEIKTKNIFLISFQLNKISIVNSNNFKIKKHFDFNLFSMHSTICLINDNYFLLSEYNSQKEEKLFLYNLDNFEKVKTFNSKNENIEIFPIKENFFFTSELEGNNEKSTIIKIWKFDEKNKDIILLESFNFTKFSQKIISGENDFSSLKPIQGSDNLYIINFKHMINRIDEIQFLSIFNIINNNLK